MKKTEGVYNGFFTSDRHKNELSVPEPARQDPKGGESARFVTLQFFEERFVIRAKRFQGPGARPARLVVIPGRTYLTIRNRGETPLKG